ncbi:MAG: oligosaccharide flippase family protein [Thermodesulfobacteriota bacterium]
MSTIARKIGSGSVLRIINFFAQVLVAFFLMPFVVISLGDRMYGLWTLVGTFIGYYGVLDLGLSSAVQRYIAGAIGARNKDEMNRIFNTSVIIFTGLGIVVLLITIVLAGLSPLIFTNLDERSLFSKIILLLGINIAISMPIRTFRGVLNAQLRFDIIAVIEFTSLVLRSALVVLSLSLGYKLLGLALVTFLSSIPGNILFVFFAMKGLPFITLKREYWDRGTRKFLFSYSFFTFIARIADHIRFHVDVFIITAFMGLSEVTHYRIASLLIIYFIDLMGAAMGVLTSLFSQQDGAKNLEAIRKTFFLATKISICVSSFIGFGLIAWGKPFIERWMGPEYLDAYPPLFILVLGCIIALWQTPSFALLYGTSKHGAIALFNSLEGVFNLLISFLLVRHYGLIGVAFGTFLPMVVNKLAIQPIYLSRVSPIQYVEYIYRVSRTAAIVCISLVIPTFISFYFAAPEFRILFPLGLVSSLFYFLGIWFMEFSLSERKILQHAIFPKLYTKEIAV